MRLACGDSRSADADGDDAGVVAAATKASPSTSYYRKYATSPFCSSAGPLIVNADVVHESYDDTAVVAAARAAGAHANVGAAFMDTIPTSATAAINVPISLTHRFPPVAQLGTTMRKRILVTGGAGFVGSHLVDRLMQQGHEVTVLDNFFTGRKANVRHWIGHPHFDLVEGDVVTPFMRECDQIYHLACPASPPHYQYNAIKTLKTSTLGTLNMLGLARRVRARLLFTSTSEVYGDPDVHPQPESYHGNVNTLGPRACYDEGKRVAETMCLAYHQQHGVDVRVARIFNTFGPRMHPCDGRVVSNFIMAALTDEDLRVHGSGTQTRSFQYVSDLIDGLVALMNSTGGSGAGDDACNGVVPVNLGNPGEISMTDFAALVTSLVDGTTSAVVHVAATKDDPRRRQPDIRRAKRLLRWRPRVSVEEGLARTIEYFRGELPLMK